MKDNGSSAHVVIIGAGFCGLAAAYELVKKGARVTVLEHEAEVGGLAGSFPVDGTQLEKFYHHWFTNDQHIMQLISELQADDQVILRPTRTGTYYANTFFKLSSPLDVLRFKALAPVDRIRLGLLALRARGIREWQGLENVSAADWLRQLGGEQVYKVVWEPLLRGKFGDYAEEVSAVWFWNKLKLRGGSRGKGGAEMLAYYKGGFAALAARLAAKIRELGGTIRLDSRVDALLSIQGRITGVSVAGEAITADLVIATPALPIVAQLVAPHVGPDYVSSLLRVKYLSNVCLVLQLDRSLSEIYWLNVNDPAFPFVGVIEHTNFEPPATYGGKHIVYLSKYLAESSALYQMTDEALLEYTVPYLRRMFPAFSREWVRAFHVWRARYSQPIVERHYSQLIPEYETPLGGLYLASMAQVYPEDRGTNYAVREGKRIADRVRAQIASCAA